MAVDADGSAQEVHAVQREADKARTAELTERAADLEAIEATKLAARPPHGAPSMLRGTDTSESIDPNRLAPAELARSARDVIEAEHRSERVSDAGAEALTAAVTNGADTADARSVARLALVTGSDAYRSGFSKVLVGGTDAVLELTDAERQAFALARTEARALSLAGQGAALVPLSLDPAISLVGGGSISAIRQLATSKIVASNEHQVVRSAGVTATWKSEGQEEADNSPTVAPTKITVHKGTAYVQYTEELAWDDPMLLDDLGVMLRDAADELTAAAFVNGAGSATVPQGLLTGLVAAPGSIVSGSAFNLETDPARLLAAVPPRHRKAASFLAHGNFINMLEFTETSNGSLMYPTIGQGKLLRRDLHEESLFPAAIAANPATTSVMVAGDIAKTYLIVNRLGTVIQLVPTLFGANARPTGESGLRMVFRTGAGVVAPEAARVLRITPAS